MEKLNPSFWKGRRVLVTGHTGFKGSWLALWLRHLGADVTGFALLPPTVPSFFDVVGVGEGIRSIVGDVRDYDRVSQVVRDTAPEIIFHMAAQPLVRYSYANPIETYQTNVMGTVHLLEATRRVGSVRALLNVTSDKAYENREWMWGYRENESLGGHDPYSSSKACSELVTAAFRNSYFPADDYSNHGVAIATARAGNVIGGGDWATDRLLPDILRAVSNGEVVDIRAPTAIRPWQHVLEPLLGYLTLGERLVIDGPDYAEAWNFGPAEDDARPVSWIADRMTQLWSADAGWVSSSGSHPHEAHYLRLDCSKARHRLDWQSRWPLEVALERVISWHKAYLAGADMHLHSLNDIDTFMKARS